MNNIIREYVAEQENLNKEMSVNDLNACIAKARMGFTCLKESLDKTIKVVSAKSGGTCKYSSEVKNKVVNRICM